MAIRNNAGNDNASANQSHVLQHQRDERTPAADQAKTGAASRAPGQQKANDKQQPKVKERAQHLLQGARDVLAGTVGEAIYSRAARAGGTYKAMEKFASKESAAAQKKYDGLGMMKAALKGVAPDKNTLKSMAVRAEKKSAKAAEKRQEKATQAARSERRMKRYDDYGS